MIIFLFLIIPTSNKEPHTVHRCRIEIRCKIYLLIHTEEHMQHIQTEDLHKYHGTHLKHHHLWSGQIKINQLLLICKK